MGCRTADFLISRWRQKTDSPPFWGAEDQSEALKSVRALRNWLYDEKNRYVLFLLAFGAVETDVPTGLDREIASILVHYERSGQLHFGTLDKSILANVPRRSILKGDGSDAFYGERQAVPAFAGSFIGACDLFSSSTGVSWLAFIRETFNLCRLIGWAHRVLACLPLSTRNSLCVHSAFSRGFRTPCCARN